MQVRHLSIDPTIRTWMNDAPGYLPPIGIGDVIRSGGIGEVVELEERPLPARRARLRDDRLAGLRHRRRGRGSMQPIPDGLDPPTALNVFGINGMTAYFGLLDVGRMQAGDVVVVSGAAGATGSIGRSDRQAEGRRQGRSASPAGRTSAPTSSTSSASTRPSTTIRAGRRPAARGVPDGIDVYFDNVGGDILNSLPGPDRHAGPGRALRCHLAYNATEPAPDRPTTSTSSSGADGWRASSSSTT